MGNDGGCGWVYDSHSPVTNVLLLRIAQALERMVEMEEDKVKAAKEKEAEYRKLTGRGC